MSGQIFPECIWMTLSGPAFGQSVGRRKPWWQARNLCGLRWDPTPSLWWVDRITSCQKPSLRADSGCLVFERQCIKGKSSLTKLNMWLKYRWRGNSCTWDTVSSSFYPFFPVFEVGKTIICWLNYAKCWTDLKPTTPTEKCKTKSSSRRSLQKSNSYIKNTSFYTFVKKASLKYWRIMT